MHRAPAGRWRYTWLVAVLAVVVPVLSYEFYLRSHGYEPAVQDTPALWAMTRAEISETDKTPLVLLGSSRTITGFDPAVVEESIPHVEAYQLAITASHPAPVLRDLAEDPDFDGIVIFDVFPAQLFHEDLALGAELPETHIAHYKNRSWIADFETTLQIKWQQFSVLGTPDTNPNRVLPSVLILKRPPEPSRQTLRTDRFREHDFANRDWKPFIEAFERIAAEIPPATPTQLDRMAARFNEHIDKIEARGGTVIFIRAKSDGAVRRAEEAHFPREKYWDYLTDRLHAESLHFEDIPELERFSCPDGSHIDKRESAAYTRAWMQALAAEFAEALSSLKR